MSQFFRNISLSARQVAPVRALPHNFQSIRAFTISHARFSAAGYGDDPTEGASNSGTITPASSPDPKKGAQGKVSGSTDPEVKPKKTSGGKQDSGADMTHSEDVDPATQKALGTASGGEANRSDKSSRAPGETAAPDEKKLPGKPVEKA